MIDGHITTVEMEKFCAGLLPLDRVIACSAHLDECPLCHGLYDSTSRTVCCTRPLIFDFTNDAWQIGDHPEYDELADYAAGELDREYGEIIKGHLENCERCGREVEDFKAFLRAIEPEMSIEFRPDGSYLKFIRGLRRGLQPIFLSPLPIAISALLLVAAAALVLLNASRLRQGAIETRADVHGPPASPDILPAVTPTPEAVGTEGQGAVEREAADVPRLRASITEGGRTYGVDDRGKPYGMDRLPPSVRPLLVSALLRNGPERPEILDRLRTRSVSYRSKGDSPPTPATASPDGTVILTDRPTLSWEPGARAEAYRVVLADLRFNPVAESLWVKGTSWQLPFALGRGETYLWQVWGRSKGDEAEGDLILEARFKVIEAEGAKRVAAVRQTIGSPFISGLVMAQEGVLDGAEEELRKVAGHSPPAKRLLRQIRSWRE